MARFSCRLQKYAVWRKQILAHSLWYSSTDFFRLHFSGTAQNEEVDYKHAVFNKKPPCLVNMGNMCKPMLFSNSTDEMFTFFFSNT